MNKTQKKFSADLLADFKTALETQKTDAILAKIKAADTGTFSVVISTSDEDRQGDSLDQTKWKLDNYEANPVVLWAHDYYNLPIGVCTSVGVKDGKLVAEGKFATEDLNPFAAQIAGLYAAGFIKATSVGYVQHEDGTLELLEFSFVPVPANPFALSMRAVKKLNLNIPQLVMKGIQFETKAEQVGDACQTEDGEPGVLAEDPNNPGTLICVPKEKAAAKSNENDGDMNNDLLKAMKAEHDRHGQAVATAITEHEGKPVQEFKEAIHDEHQEHLQKCLKAVDENYLLSDRKKSYGDFKSALVNENYKHIEETSKAISEFDKNMDEFTTTMKAELDRHEKSHMDLCEAEMGAGEEDEAKAIQNLIAKAGRQISAKNKEKLSAAIKSLEDGHMEHGKAIQSTIAALKELMGDEGEEKPKAVSPNERPRSAGAAINKNDPEEKTMSDFEVFMFTRTLLKTVNSASSEGLAKLKDVFREKFPDRR
jgi:hypothetical protein